MESNWIDLKGVAHHICLQVYRSEDIYQQQALDRLIDDTLKIQANQVGISRLECKGHLPPYQSRPGNI